MTADPSRVAQSHSGYRSNKGRCVNTTIRASFFICFRSDCNHSSCLSPTLPEGSETLSRLMK